MTKDKAVELIYKAIPYSNHITKLDTTSEEKAIRFTWRGDRFRFIIDYMSVEEVGNGILMGSNMAILMGSILKSAYVNEPKQQPSETWER